MKLPALAVLLMLLSACSTTPSTQPMPPRPLPVEAMVLVPELPKVAGPTAGDLARWIKDAADMYGPCRADQWAMIEWIGRGR